MNMCRQYLEKGFCISGYTLEGKTTLVGKNKFMVDKSKRIFPCRMFDCLNSMSNYLETMDEKM